MEIRYDVLKEPWIPVTDQNGEKKLFGMLDVLGQAHQLREITDASPLVEYGLYRLLCVFLMDALRPGDTEDIEELLAEGKFDMNHIETYVERCRASGASFDLFDEKRPFLQSAYVPEWDKERKSIGYLDRHIPAGDNLVHFEHLDQEPVLSYAEAARLLPACYIFMVRGGRGYHTGIACANGVPPFFTIIKGENLFQTLVYTMVPLDGINDFDSLPAFWNYGSAVLPNQKFDTVSWLFGMLFPVRRVTLIPEEDGIHQIYFSPGVYLNLLDNWTDPHASYVMTEKKRIVIGPEEGRPIWKNLNYLINVPGKTAPENLCTYASIYSGANEMANVCLYGVYTQKTSLRYLELVRYDLELSTSMMNDETAEIIGCCIKAAEVLGKKMESALDFEVSKGKNSTSHGVARHLSAAAVNDFYYGCEQRLLQLCHEDWTFRKKEPDAIVREWKLTLYHLGKEAVEEAFSKVSLTGKQWVEAYEKQVDLEKYLNRLKREGENKGGKKR